MTLTLLAAWLLYLAVQDLQTRRVSNKQILLGLLFFPLTWPWQAWHSLPSLVLVGSLFLYAYQRGLLGGADLKLMGVWVILLGWGPHALSTLTIVWGHVAFVLAVCLRPVLPTRWRQAKWPFIPFLFLGYLCAWAWHVYHSQV